MNWRYVLGKSFSIVKHTVLSSPMMPITRGVPIGISYPYDIKRFMKNHSCNVIFDVGANIGQTTCFLSPYFPKAQILAFEPVKSTFDILTKNISDLHHAKALNYALGSSHKEMTIRVRSNSELNTLTPNNIGRDSDSDTFDAIQVTTIDQICQLQDIHKIDLLKMDVQGYEIETLKGAQNLLDNNLIKFVYSEVGFDPSDTECQSFNEINTYLNQYDFKLSGFYEIFRWGESKKYSGFCNALFVHTSV
jgi:FkbM family methyltransferase